MLWTAEIGGCPGERWATAEGTPIFFPKNPLGGACEFPRGICHGRGARNRGIFERTIPPAGGSHNRLSLRIGLPERDGVSKTVP